MADTSVLPCKRPSTDLEKPVAAGPAKAADIFMKAWASREWISEVSQYPAPPSGISELYDTFLAMACHPIAASHFGGLGGYKLGAIGVEGQPSLSGPLFRNFLCDGPASPSSAAIQNFCLEAEVGVLMGSALPARADGAPHSRDDVWAAVEFVVPCIECCGRRITEELGNHLPQLGKIADGLASGGVVLGEKFSRREVALDAAELATCKTSLCINGVEVCKGAGSEVPLGGPVEALTWFANDLNGRGLALQKGQLVITGATCKSKAFKPGDKVSASFVIGSVTKTLDMDVAP